MNSSLAKKTKKFKNICIKIDIYIWKYLATFGQRNLNFMSVYVYVKYIFHCDTEFLN